MKIKSQRLIPFVQKSDNDNRARLQLNKAINCPFCKKPHQARTFFANAPLETKYKNSKELGEVAEIVCSGYIVTKKGKIVFFTTE